MKTTRCTPGGLASLGLASLAAACLAIPAHAGLFNNNFNTDPSGVVTLVDPAKWVDSGGVGGSGYVSLTDAVNSLQSAMYIDDLDGGSPVAGFAATFKLRIGGGTGNPADGFSFNWADNLSGGSISEEGTGNGLIVAFDIYDNGGGEAPAIDVKIGGLVVASKILPKDTTTAGILTGDAFVDVRIEYRNGLLDIDYKGQSIHNDLAIGLAPISGGRFAFGARTGGENVNQWLDDVRIETFAQTAPAIAGVRPTAQGVTLQLKDATGAAVDPATVQATFDGAAVVGVATKSGDTTSYIYNGASLLAPGSTHPVVLSYKYGAAATAATLSFTITTPNYTIVPASAAIPASAINTAQRGFAWRIHQVDSETALATSKARAMDQIAGLLGANVADPSFVGGADAAAAAPSPATAPIEFKVSNVINFSQAEGSAYGSFTPDLGMPGIPGTTGGTDNAAAAVVTALEFPASGTYTMIVNSDDGFVTAVAKNPNDLFATTVGIFDTGRGATDTVFDFYIEAAGIYPFRTLWHEGSGDASIEWVQILPTGTRVLLNDTAASPLAIKAYQLPNAAVPAYVQSVVPAPGATALLQAKTVEATLIDAGTQVSTAGISLKLNGATVTVTTTKTGGQTKVLYNGGLTPGTDYTAELTYSDGTTPRTISWTFNSGLVNTPLFVIEAEDFDYDGGQANPQKGTSGLDVDVMPYLGGAYDGLSSVKGVDYNNADGNDSDFYRTELDANGENEVNISARNSVAAGNGLGGNPGIGSSDRLTYTTTVNYGIGWVGGGDWQNYTRTFPTTGTGWWSVFAGLSYGGTDAGQLSGTMDRVTAGVGTETQTTERLGEFTGPGSGGWANNNLVPMKTASGAPAIVKLTGKNTVRFNLNSGDFDFLIFSPASPPPPTVQSVPQDSGTKTNVVLDWVLGDTDSKVNPATVKVEFGGQDVSSKTVVTKTATGATVNLNLAGTTYPAGEIPWKLSFADTSTPPQTVEASGTYVVVPYPGTGIFVVEAEDFNYSDDGVVGGKTNPQKGTETLDVDVMPYVGGAYAGLAAVKGVDYNNADANDSDLYRTELDANGENEVNIGSGSSRYATERGWFEATANFRIGWVATGEWQNYTRTFPQGSFNIWAAMSYDGRSPGQLNGSLDRVTSDPTKPDQTTERIGTFIAPGSGGWGRNELVPLKNSAGAIATVPMGGVQTVRINLGSGDVDYIILVPTAGEAPRFTGITRNANGSITVQWTGGGTLQSAPSVTGPWSDVPGASSPATLTPTGGQIYGRIRQ